LGPKRFRTILEKRTPAYSLGAPLLGLAKFIYYVFKGSDEELMAHSEDEQESDTAANKGQNQ